MAEVVKLEQAVSVRFPEMRVRLSQAVDALCDQHLQDRLWLQGGRLSADEDGFDDTLLFLVDEMEMFGTTELVGDVLVDDSELIAFKELVAAVESLIEAIGKRGSFSDALETGALWDSCVAKAREMKRRLNIEDRGRKPPAASS